MPLRIRSEMASYENKRTGQASGGVALLFQGTPAHSVIYRKVTDHLQAVAVRMAGISIATVYVNPDIRKQNFLTEFQRLSTVCPGRAIMMGDFNARHETWCQRRKTIGSTPENWADKNGWRVEASAEPTFGSSRYTSNPDLFVYRACTMGTVESPEGI